MQELVIAYVTCGSLEEARRIGRTLVEERLAGCVNIRPHEAIYRWQGDIEAGPEYGVVAKTSRDVFPRLCDRVVALHSADTPCVVAIPILDGHRGFLDWVAAETSP